MSASKRPNGRKFADKAEFVLHVLSDCAQNLPFRIETHGFTSLGSKDFPHSPGVYVAFIGMAVAYVGSAIDLKKRWAAHHRYQQLQERGCRHLLYLTLNSAVIRSAEAILIRRLNPTLNGQAIRPLRFKDKDAEEKAMSILWTLEMELRRCGG